MKDGIIRRLAFPESAVVNKILAKDTIVQTGGLTAKEKDYLTSEIERVYILAILNEQGANIPAFRSNQHRYEEILCLYVQLRSTTKAEQLMKLFHKIFPNPVFLIIGLPEKEIILSTCHKRLNLQDNEKVVNEEVKTTEPFRLINEEAYEEFINEMAFNKMPFSDLYKRYDWMHNNIQLARAVPYIGVYPESTENREEMVQSLNFIEELEIEIGKFLREQKKAIEFNEKMDWHMKIKRKEQQLKKEIEGLKEKI